VIETQDKTPGAHAAAEPSESVSGDLPVMLTELGRRDEAARGKVRHWLEDNLVQSPFDPALAEFEVQVTLDPDLESRPENFGFDERAQKIAFREHHWWFKVAGVEIWLVPNQGSDQTENLDPLRVASATRPGCAEGNVPARDGFVAAWEGEYGWMELLQQAVNEANQLLSLLKSGYVLSVEPKDPDAPTPAPAPGAGFAQS
jgi:hypothetical protein